jgi:hypothetical protein
MKDWRPEDAANDPYTPVPGAGMAGDMAAQQDILQFEDLPPAIQAELKRQRRQQLKAFWLNTAISFVLSTFSTFVAVLAALWIWPHLVLLVSR